MSEPARRLGPAVDEGFRDPDLDTPHPPEASPLEGLLGELEAELSKKVTNDPIVLEVIKRPGVAVRYKTELVEEDLNGFRAKAKDPRAPGEFNSLRFCCMILAAQSDGFFMNGTEVFDEAGQKLKFGHARLRKLFGAERAAEVARKAIGNDAHVQITANKVLDASGYGDQAVEVEEGPTDAS